MSLFSWTLRTVPTPEIRCPHCRHAVVVTTRGILGGVLRHLVTRLRIRECRQRGGRVHCGNCGRAFILVGDRSKFDPRVVKAMKRRAGRA
jgi:transcription elongation factor Elf1